MPCITKKTFPLYDWWYCPETAGINDTRELIKVLLESRNLLESKAVYHSPYLMGGMMAAVERIKKAISDKEKILIHGDYDVDGIVGSVLLFRFLKSIGADPLMFLPTRQEHGYGLALDAVEKACKEGISLIITVDCGIADLKNIDCGVEKGIDFIITDHHQIPEKLPDAVAIIHAGMPGEEYPYESLSGAAVAFKLIQALSENLGKKINTAEYYPYVALSVITDIMPLTGENWLFVRDGIKALLTGYAPHIELLAKAGGYTLNQIGPRELGIHVGSRLNAPGRLVSPILSAKYLLESNPKRMAKIATKIEKINNQRRDIQEEVARKALEKAKQEQDVPIHVLYSDDWHEGLLGTAASRVVDETGHPVILLTRCEQEFLRGSGRAPDGVDLFNLLTCFSDMMTHFGGHSGACGLTIEEKRFEEFRNCLIEKIQGEYPDGFPSPRIEIAAQLSAKDMNLKFTEELNVLEPCGRGNPRPVFEVSPVCIERAEFVGGGNHLRLDMKDSNKKLKGIIFKINGVRPGDIIGRPISIAASPVINEFNDRKNIEFHVQDLRPLD